MGRGGNHRQHGMGENANDDETTPLNTYSQKKKKILHLANNAKNKKKKKTQPKKKNRDEFDDDDEDGDDRDSVGNRLSRWFVLLLCCTVMATMYYILAMPAALHNPLYAIMSSPPGGDDSDDSANKDNFEMNFNLLFTVSYFPNMVLPMFGGAVVDRLGASRCVLVFCCVVALGQTVTAVGVASTDWTYMLAGRFLFGLGAQNLIVANAALISRWFLGNEGVALGLSNVFSYAGVIATNVTSPKIANTVSPAFAFWFGVGLECIAIVIAIGIVALDTQHHHQRQNATKQVHFDNQHDDDLPLICSPMFSPVAYTFDHFSPSVHADQISSPGGVVFGILQNQQQDQQQHEKDKNMTSYQTHTNHEGDDATIATTHSHATTATTALELTDVNTTKPSTWQILRNFKPTFWLLCASFLLVYGVVWSFTNVSSAILLERDFFVVEQGQRPSFSVQQQTSTGMSPTLPDPCSGSNVVAMLPPSFQDQCTSGALSPARNTVYNNRHEESSCRQTNRYNRVYAPVIPRSLNITIHTDEEEEEDMHGDDSTVVADNDPLPSFLFEHGEYKYEHLKPSDIQCHDPFWSEACTMDYCEVLSDATEKAGFYMSIPYFFTVALTSILGIFVDKTGLRAEMICFGSFLLILAHLLLAYPSSSPPLVPLVGQGLGYTICVSALWPSVPFTVSADSVGTAFGIMMGVQNIGLALIPLIVAWLYGLADNHYLPLVELFFAASSFLAVVVAVLLVVADRKTDNVLGTPKPQIRVIKENETFVMVAPASHPLQHRRANSEAGAMLLKPRIPNTNLLHA